MKINCLILSDSVSDRQTIEAHVSQLPHVYILGFCCTGEEACRILKGLTVDILIIDIEIPHDGLEAIAKQFPFTMFITEDDLPKGRSSLHPASSIRKPITFANFNSAIEKAMKSIAASETMPVNFAGF